MKKIICKFYIKKCCRHGLRGNNCNYPHPVPRKKYIENPENGCRPECTNLHHDICKYSRKLTKCYNVNCYRIHLKGQCAQDPHKYNSMLYHARKQTSFITLTALQTMPLKTNLTIPTNLTKPLVPLTLLTLPAPLLVPALSLIPRT